MTTYQKSLYMALRSMGFNHIFCILSVCRMGEAGMLCGRLEIDIPLVAREAAEILLAWE